MSDQSEQRDESRVRTIQRRASPPDCWQQTSEQQRMRSHKPEQTPANVLLTARIRETQPLLVCTRCPALSRTHRKAVKLGNGACLLSCCRMTLCTGRGGTTLWVFMYAQSGVRRPGCKANSHTFVFASSSVKLRQNQAAACIQDLTSKNEHLCLVYTRGCIRVQIAFAAAHGH